MIYITGDTHGDFRRFSSRAFPEQAGLDRDDFVVICGDFGGVWKPQADADERYWLDWLDDKPFTTLFGDGNHENFARLDGDEFPRLDFHGGVAQRIRAHIYRLGRGEVFELDGKRVFAFGGAASHDIEDGILDPNGQDPVIFRRKCRRWRQEGRRFRVLGETWWPRELPDEAELERGRAALANVENHVDIVISHCLPQDVIPFLRTGPYAPDRLTLYFNDLLHRGLRFDRWYCGHYHMDRTVMGRFRVLYEDIVPVAGGTQVL